MLKKYIIKKLSEWLELENIKDDISDQNIHHKRLQIACSNMAEDIEKSRKQIININKVFDIGVDVGRDREPNWAVICVDGKPNYVKFVSLNRSDVGNIQSFLRQFEGSSRVVDTPIGMDYIFRDEELFDWR